MNPNDKHTLRRHEHDERMLRLHEQQNELYEGVERMLKHMEEWYLDIQDFDDFDFLIPVMEDKVMDYRTEHPGSAIDIDTWGWDFADRIEMQEVFEYAKGFANL